MRKTVEMSSAPSLFRIDDLLHLSELVATTWTSAADQDWSVRAGTLDWTCLQTADHAVDCVYAPAFFLASRRTDSYPDVGLDLTLGQRANPVLLVESLRIATRILTAVINDAEPAARAVIFRRPNVVVAPAADFAPRGALELILHAHDVCSGLGVSFVPPLQICERLREHTRNWLMWKTTWGPLETTTNPWADLLNASGRSDQIVD
jgi:hypothetical protein